MYSKTITHYSIDNTVGQKFKVALCCFVLFSYLLFFYFLACRIFYPISEWTISDWLINYEDGGFKRRGLSGTVLFKIQDITGVSLQLQVIIILISSYTLILCVLYNYLRNKVIDLYFIGLLLSPFTLIYPFTNIILSGRKEVLLLLLFYTYAFSKRTVIYDYLTLVAYVFIIFTHELAIFYLPFLLWINLKKNNSKLDLPFFSVTIFFSVVSVCLIYFLGGNINQGKSLALLASRDIRFGNANIFDGEFLFDFRHVLKYKLSFSIHLLEFLIVFLQFFYYVFKYQSKYFKEFALGASICLICIFPLMYLAIDWTRWFYIYFSLLLIVIMLQLPSKHSSLACYKNDKVKVWQLFITPFATLLLLAHTVHTFNHNIVSDILALFSI